MQSKSKINHYSRYYSGITFSKCMYECNIDDKCLTVSFGSVDNVDVCYLSAYVDAHPTDNYLFTTYSGKTKEYA
jgi:hypothetical protein